tara:strand:+ start:5716 stop:5883 length:168 start_codon:yes stop_codon:yes gene_type:complete
MKKYIVAVKYFNDDKQIYENEIFQFSNLEDRTRFINDTKTIAEDYIISEIEENKD